MNVNGSWVNVYGSVVTLLQLDDGVVVGTYSSTTGASGTYWVAGFTDPNPPTNGNGQSLAFTILWRSFDGGTPNPSWHYVSGFSGQMIVIDGTPSLVMIHDMVATAVDPGVVDIIGSYPDKLTYVPRPPGPPPNWPPPFQPPTSDPVNGTWTCIQDPSITLSLAVQDEISGYLTGTLTTATGSVPLTGFTDTGAGSDGLTLQGLTVAALLPDGHMVVAIAGYLNLVTNSLTMSWFESNGTAADSTWTQTRLRGFDFRRR